MTPSLPDSERSRGHLCVALDSDGLIDAFQRATGLAVDLDMTPRWRPLRRRRLRSELAAACAAADRELIARGGQPITPFAEILAETSQLGRVA